MIARIARTLLACLFLTISAVALEAPKVFQTLDYPTASAQAKKQNRWLLVDATATWCPPCRQMDATTWVDPTVHEYFQENVVAIQIDVDEQEELAARLGIKAMPTVIVFGPEGELDRVVGYKSAEELLAWLSDLRQGKTQADHLRAKAAQGDLEARYDLATYLLDSGKAEEAEGLLISLWTDMRGTPFRGVRHSYLIDSLAQVVEQSPTAGEKLEAIRVEALAKKDFEDWFFLSKALGHHSELLAWEPEKPLSPALEDVYFRYLAENQQLEKAGKLIEDPAAKARERLDRRATMLEASGEMDSEMREEFASYARGSAQEDLLILYAACQAAGRDAEAKAVRQIAIDDDAEMTVQFEALDESADQP